MGSFAKLLVFFNCINFLLFSRKLRWVLTNRLLKFFQERHKKDEEKYLQFYDDYGLFFREGIVSSPDQAERVRLTLVFLGLSI